MTRPGLRASVLALVVLVATVLAGGPAGAVETATLTPTQDSFVNQATPTTNSGTFNLLTVYNKTNNERRGLVQFSLTTVPSDASIKTGTLTLFMTAAPTSSRTYGALHEINITTGVDQKQRTVPGTPTVGDPSIDYTNNRLYVGASDGNVYAFDVPF